MNKDKHDSFEYMHPEPLKVGISGCCPRCGQGRLFESLLKPATACLSCKLDYSFIDSGDGPAVFVILIIGFFVTGLALALQASINPPIWVHLVLWIPLIIALSLWGLRLAKGIMISLQFRTKARQAELGDTK